MTFVRLWFQGATLALAILGAGGAEATGASPWDPGFHSRARLVDGGDRAGKRLAGIEIALDTGFKTYWRSPGESGLPPRFDWSGSTNIAAVEIRWPAPMRVEDAGGITYGYEDGVLLPVEVRPADPARPVELRLILDYGVCKDICIPENADLSLSLGDGSDYRADIEEALAAVPKPQPLGAEGPLAVLDSKPLAGDKPALAVRVRVPPGSRPVLFAEGPDDWYLSPASTPDGDVFRVTVDERPKNASGEVPIRLTLVAGDKAIETELRLDATLRPR